MANKPLRTIKFPGLDDTYTVPQVDSIMSGTSTNPVQNKVVKEYTDALRSGLANEYNSATTYAVGDFCIYNNLLYECTTEITTAEAWNSSHWTLTNVSDEISDLKEDLTQLQTDMAKGNFPEMSVGSADQLISDGYVVENELYQFRRSGGSADIGTRMEDVIVGGTVVWNQLVQNGNFASVSIWIPGNATYTVSNNIATIIPKPASTSSYLSFPNTHRQSGHKYLMLLSYKKDSTNSSDTEYLQWYNGSGWNSWSASNDTSWHDVAKILTFSGIDDGDMIRIARNYANGDTIEYKNVQIFDLTAMFGTEIADYIYSLEQATAGAGVAFFRKFFPKDYYTYNAGELISVSGLSEHKTVGFNLWDEETILAWGPHLETKNYQSCLPNTRYYLHGPALSPQLFAYGFMWYDENKDLISTVYYQAGMTPTSPSKARYFKFGLGESYGSVYKHDVCINIFDPAKNGTYEPYKGHSYPLDDNLTLRGIPKLDSNNKLYFDGDRYLANGVVERKYGIVNLGTLEWIKGNRNNDDTGYNFYIGRSDFPSTAPTYKKAGKCCSSKLVTWTGTTSMWENIAVNHICIVSDYIVCTYEANTANDFKTAMSGAMLVYELATPTTETADPYHNPQIVDPEGTEEYITTSLVPVGHETKYFEDLKGKIEGLPSNFATLIADTESTFKATKNYAQGDYLIVNNQLYKVSSAITSGSTITPGTNVTATTIMAEIMALA